MALQEAFGSPVDHPMSYFELPTYEDKFFIILKRV